MDGWWMVRMDGCAQAKKECRAFFFSDLIIVAFSQQNAWLQCNTYDVLVIRVLTHLVFPEREWQKKIS